MVENGARIHHRNPKGTRAMHRTVTLASQVFFFLAVVVCATAAAATPVTLQWSDVWDGPFQSDDQADEVAFDGDDRLYVAGRTYEPGLEGNDQDLFLRRYSADGVLEWAVVYPGVEREQPTDLFVAANGDVLIVGQTAGSSGVFAFVRRIDPTGGLVWERFLGPHAFAALENFHPQGEEGPSGAIAVSLSTGEDFRVDLLDPSGATIWSRVHDGPFGGGDRASDVAIDADGSVYVTGQSWNPAVFEQAAVTVKYDALGNPVWEDVDGGLIGTFFGYGGVEIAADGNVVVAANPESSCGSFAGRVWKLDATTGARLWTDSYPDAPCGVLEPTELVTAPDGDSVLVGFGSVLVPRTRMITIRHDADGTRSFVRGHDAPDGPVHRARAVTIDTDGGAIVAGDGDAPDGTPGQVLVKYGPDGDVVWDQRWSPPSGGNGRALDVAVSPGGGVAVVGYAFDPATRQDATVVVSQQGSLTSSPSPGGEAVDLSCTPNIFRASTRVRFAFSRTAPARLDVFDVRGRLLRTLFRGDVAEHAVTWDGRDMRGRLLGSGIYFLRLSSPDGVASIRVGKLR